MYSRIYQLSTSPISKDEFITTEDIAYAPFNFIGDIADYVDDIPEAQIGSEFVALYRAMSHANNSHPFAVNMVKTTLDSPHTFIFGDNFRIGYFADKFANFQTMLERLSGIDQETFSTNEANSLGYMMYLLREAVDNRFGYYIWIDDDLLTLDEFVRSCELNTPYYCGNVLDYHF